MTVQTYIDASEAMKYVFTNNKYGLGKLHLLIFPYLHCSRTTIMYTEERHFQTCFTRAFHAMKELLT